MLAKRKVFRPIIRIPEGLKPIGYIWIFAQKQIKNDEIVRYKAQLVTQGFSQNPILICEKTYSLVLDATTLQYLIILVVQQGLHLYLMDEVTTYLYGYLENDIYTKIPRGFYLPNKRNSKEGYSRKLNKSFY